MSISTSSEHQIIRAEGVPVAVVVPYDDYLRMTAKDDDNVTLPNEVVGLILAGKTTVRAWREYLGLTQAVIAESMGITQSAWIMQIASASTMDGKATITFSLCSASISA